MSIGFVKLRTPTRTLRAVLGSPIPLFTRPASDYSGRMLRAALISICGVLLVGCRSSDWGPYVSPSVRGQVLDADTGKPLARVKVTRGRFWASNNQPPKGGEQLMRQPEVLTDSAGHFRMSSERVLTLYRFGGWSSVRLTFDCAGYRQFTTNYSGAALLITNTPSGEPLVLTGDVRLRRAEEKR